MPPRRWEGPVHARARRKAQEVAVRGLVADAVAEAHEAHAAARRDPTGSARAFLNETALPAVRALNGAVAPTLLSVMHQIVNTVQPGLIRPEAALYGHWMEWHESNRSGRPLSMGDTLQLTGAGSAMSLRSSAPALLHALRTRYPGDAAPYLNQARATYPGGVSELDAALHLLHPPDEDLVVGGITVFVEGADEAPARPRPTNPPYDGTRPTPPYAIVCEAFPREPTCCPALPPATHVPRGWANPDLSPPLSRTRGAPHRGQVLWQECPGNPLLLLSVATRGDPERVLGITPTHLYGAAPVPRPPLPAPAARDGGHTFLPTQEVNAVTGVHLVRLPPTPPDDPRGPRALGPAPDRGLWRDAWAAWLPASPPNADGWPPAPARAGLTPRPAPHPLPPSPPQSTAQHCPRHGTDAPGGSGKGAPATTHAYQDNSDGRLQWLPPAGRRPPPPVPLPLPRLPGVDGGHPRGARGAEAGGGGGAGRAPSAQEPEPAEVTAPAAQAASPAAPPREGAQDAQEAETAAPASHAAALTAAPGTPPTRAVAPAQEPGASPRAAAAAEESGEGARGVAIAAPGKLRHRLGRPRRNPQYALQAREGPRTGHGRLAGGCRSSSSGQGEREVPRPRQPHPHPHQSPKAVPPQALPPRADAARPPPGVRALAAGRHAAAAAKTAGRPARDPGGRGRRAGRAACQPRERGAGDRRRQGKCPGARAKRRPGHARRGARAQQRRGTERRQRTARLRAGGREGTRAREWRVGVRAGRPGAGSGARDGGRAGGPGRGGQGAGTVARTGCRKGPKGKGKGAAGPKGQTGRGMGARGGGWAGGRGAGGRGAPAAGRAAG